MVYVNENYPPLTFIDVDGVVVVDDRGPLASGRGVAGIGAGISVNLNAGLVGVHIHGGRQVDRLRRIIYRVD